MLSDNFWLSYLPFFDVTMERVSKKEAENDLKKLTEKSLPQLWSAPCWQSSEQ